MTWLTCRGVCICVCLCLSVVGERRCTKFNTPQPRLNTSPDCVYTVGMIYVSWTNSGPGSEGSQILVSIIPPGQASYGKEKGRSIDDVEESMI